MNLQFDYVQFTTCVSNYRKRIFVFVDSHSAKYYLINQPINLLTY